MKISSPKLPVPHQDELAGRESFEAHGAVGVELGVAGRFDSCLDGKWGGIVGRDALPCIDGARGSPGT